MSKPLRRCREVVERDRRVISRASRIAYYPLVVSRAEGSRIWDLDENECLDFLSGAAVNNVGHCHPEVVRAIEAQARRLGETAMKRFQGMEDRFDLIGDIRGRGLLIGVEFVTDRETKEPARREALKVSWRAWERGLVMISFGRCGNVLRIAPPLTIGEDELEKALDIVEGSIEDVVEGRVPDSVLREMGGW